MPAYSSDLGIDGSADEAGALSDENVAILYEIVQCAEQQPQAESQPFRAIFAAYDQVLPRYGLDSGQDQVYLRFLFQLGDGRKEHESLFASFERLLEEVGIRIEFDETQTDVSLLPRRGERHFTSDPTTRAAQNYQFSRSRRASIDTVYHSTPHHAARDSARVDSVLQYEEQARAQRPATRATSRITEKLYEVKNLPITENRLAVDRSSLHAHEISLPHKRAHLAFVPSRQPIREDGHSAPRDEHRHEVQRARAPLPEHRARTTGKSQSPEQKASFEYASWMNEWRPLSIDLLRKGEAFRAKLDCISIETIIYNWCSSALELAKKHESMSRVAQAHDAKTLQHQILEHWQSRAQAERGERAKIQDLEHRRHEYVFGADTGLLIKALSHWAHCTTDKKEEAKRIRAETLLRRCIADWAHATQQCQAVVCNFALRRGLRMWMKTCKDQNSLRNNAGEVCQQRLKSKFFKTWRLRAIETTAHLVTKRSMIRLVLQHWRLQNQTLSRDTSIARRKFTGFLCKAKLYHWQQAGLKCSTSEKQAVDVRRKQTQQNVLHIWSRQMRLRRVATTVSNMVDWRIATYAFSILIGKVRAFMHAHDINQLRLRNDALAHWHKRMRERIIVHQLDDRMLISALYKWTIESRSVCMGRVIMQRFTLMILQHLRRRNEYIMELNRVVLEHATSVLQRSLLRRIMSQWRYRVQALAEAAQSTQQSTARNLLAASVVSMNYKMTAQAELIVVASDAAQYFYLRSGLRVWKKSFIAQQRKRLRDCFLAARAFQRQRIKRRSLQAWMNQHMHISDLAADATRHGLSRRTRIATEMLKAWQARYYVKLRNDQEAGSVFQLSQQEFYLHRLRSYSQIVSGMEEAAAEEALSRTQRFAASTIRKIKVKMIEIQGQDSKAERLHQSYDRARCHDYWRHWRHRTALSRKYMPSMLGPSDESEPLMQQLGASAIGYSPPRSSGPGHLPVTNTATTEKSFSVTRLQDQMYDKSETPFHRTPRQEYAKPITPLSRSTFSRPLMLSTTPEGTPFQNRLRAQLTSASRTGNQNQDRKGKTSGLRYDTAIADGESLL